MKKLLIISVVATTFMTLFSAIVSAQTDEQFNEPVILALLFGYLGKDELTSLQLIVGYLAHYAVGFVFAAIYVYWLRKKNREASLLSGVIYGFLAGLAGVLVWMLVITIHPDPPPLNYPMYYAQLVAAHIVFGVAVAISYKLLNFKRN